MADPFAPRTMKRKNVKGLALTPAAPKPPPTSETGAMGGGRDDPGRDEQLEIGIEYRLDLRPEDLEIMKELGSGNGGTVSKVKHLTTGIVMARKVIHVEANREVRKRIVRELQIMHDCHSDYIVNFYGAFLNHNNDVIMCMEHMDVGLPKSDAFPSILDDMVQKCLFKEPDRRPTPQDLYERDPFVQAAKRTPVDLREWACSLMEKDNRKSHLIPQVSPSTQDFLRSKDSSPAQHDDRAGQTPTSGEIPIAGTGYVSSRDPYSGGGAGGVPSNRSPTRSSAAVNRAPPPPVHPGVSRGISTNSIPKMSPYGDGAGLGGSSSSSGAGVRPSSSNNNTFSLPVRPPPSGPLPPPPPRKATPEDVRRETREVREAPRRQPAYGLPPNPAYNV
ncbi:hypothetical protein GMORB2_5988 [Geosmithia morbida]|uniref:Protein kinase domain-containing protein n=1 Tax=Geosmithia morbida TaxID=1094350 RepID=A0A9P4YXE1_9HYPO|nr:uncharacterized protein GMORB2_5988 [Geosmithia morbida]KAF4124272.1 hypothetical protein GMORB2_5988 [Geosmithia morbida]